MDLYNYIYLRHLKTHKNFIKILKRKSWYTTRYQVNKYCLINYL